MFVVWLLKTILSGEACSRKTNYSIDRLDDLKAETFTSSSPAPALLPRKHRQAVLLGVLSVISPNCLLTPAPQETNPLVTPCQRLPEGESKETTDAIHHVTVTNFGFPSRPAPRRGAPFCLLFVGLDKKSGAGRGRVPAVLKLTSWILKTFTSSSPVPAGSRDTFFARPQRKYPKKWLRVWLRRYVCRKRA